MEKQLYTPIELVDQITKPIKYYTHAKPQIKSSTAARIVAAIKAGTCKPATQNAFFASFGYECVNTEVKYQKA